MSLGRVAAAQPAATPPACKDLFPGRADLIAHCEARRKCKQSKDRDGCQETAAEGSDASHANEQAAIRLLMNQNARATTTATTVLGERISVLTKDEGEVKKKVENQPSIDKRQDREIHEIRSVKTATVVSLLIGVEGQLTSLSDMYYFPSIFVILRLHLGKTLSWEFGGEFAPFVKPYLSGYTGPSWQASEHWVIFLHGAFEAHDKEFSRALFGDNAAVLRPGARWTFYSSSSLSIFGQASLEFGAAWIVEHPDSVEKSGGGNLGLGFEL